jgi:hypothetical protein
VALAGPGCEQHEDLGAFGAADGVTLVRLEMGQRSGRGVDLFAAGANLRRAVDDQHPGVLLHLMVAERLTRIEADEHGARLVLAHEHNRGAAPVRRRDFGKIPGFQGCGSVSGPG